MNLRLYAKGLIEAFLRKDVALYLYEIGDLDDFFRPHTVSHGSGNKKTIYALALNCTGSRVPTLLAFSEESSKMPELVCSILHPLPHRFHAHLSPGVEDALMNH